MKPDKDNGYELSSHNNKTNGNQNVETADPDQKCGFKEIFSLNGIKKLFAFFTVEPFLFCFILPSMMSNLAVYQLNMEKACRADLNYTKEVCNDAISGNAGDNITIEALTQSQILVAHMSAWRQPLQSSLPAILMMNVGAWSDRTGNRKALMLVPLIGELVCAVLLILATYYFLEWPLWATSLIEALPPALTGGLSIALMGSYSYIADVTTAEDRTFRLGIVGVIVTLAIPIGTSISGVLTDAVGYYGIFGINAALNIIGFVHTYFRVHDVNKKETAGTLWEKIIEFFHPKNIWSTFSLVVMSRGRRLFQILLIIFAHMVIVGPVFGEATLTYLYVLYKFAMDGVEYSLFTTYQTLIGIVGTSIAVTLFSKKLQLHDAIIGIIATASKVAGNYVYALAPTKSWFYSGPIFDIFGNVGTTAIRSLGTKVVEPEEVGKMCSVIGLVEAITPIIYTPMYAIVYEKTIETFAGMFYVVGGSMTIPAFFIFIILYVIHKKQQRDVVKNPVAKEMYAHDNDVTSL
ncbi:major facilitator superfamily domain-containing protein [Phthorimaea operculella]|nr:major facilitator superfamily domain-containing protein [Phthorimaea operculella]